MKYHSVSQLICIYVIVLCGVKSVNIISYYQMAPPGGGTIDGTAGGGAKQLKLIEKRSRTISGNIFDHLGHSPGQIQSKFGAYPMKYVPGANKYIFLTK